MIQTTLTVLIVFTAFSCGIWRVFKTFYQVVNNKNKGGCSGHCSGCLTNFKNPSVKINIKPLK